MSNWNQWIKKPLSYFKTLIYGCNAVVITYKEEIKPMQAIKECAFCSKKLELKNDKRKFCSVSCVQRERKRKEKLGIMPFCPSLNKDKKDVL